MLDLQPPMKHCCLSLKKSNLPGARGTQTTTMGTCSNPRQSITHWRRYLMHKISSSWPTIETHSRPKHLSIGMRKKALRGHHQGMGLWEIWSSQLARVSSTALREQSSATTFYSTSWTRWSGTQRGEKVTRDAHSIIKPKSSWLSQVCHSQAGSAYWDMMRAIHNLLVHLSKT